MKNNHFKPRLIAVAKKRVGLGPSATLMDVGMRAASQLKRPMPSMKGQAWKLIVELCGSDVPPKRKQSTKAYKWVADDFLQSYEWRKLRMVVITKRGARCECCGASPRDGHTVINVDHIKPRKTHPELALVESNLQVLCGPCNHGKGNWDQTDWRRRQEDDATAIARKLLASVPVLDMVQ